MQSTTPLPRFGIAVDVSLVTWQHNGPHLPASRCPTFWDGAPSMFYSDIAKTAWPLVQVVGSSEDWVGTVADHILGDSEFVEGLLEEYIQLKDCLEYLGKYSRIDQGGPLWAANLVLALPNLWHVLNLMSRYFRAPSQAAFSSGSQVLGKSINDCLVLLITLVKISDIKARNACYLHYLAFFPADPPEAGREQGTSGAADPLADPSRCKEPLNSSQKTTGRQRWEWT